MISRMIGMEAGTVEFVLIVLGVLVLVIAVVGLLMKFPRVTRAISYWIE